MKELVNFLIAICKKIVKAIETKVATIDEKIKAKNGRKHNKSVENANETVNVSTEPSTQEKVKDANRDIPDYIMKKYNSEFFMDGNFVCIRKESESIPKELLLLAVSSKPKFKLTNFYTIVNPLYEGYNVGEKIFDTRRWVRFARLIDVCVFLNIHVNIHNISFNRVQKHVKALGMELHPSTTENVKDMKESIENHIVCFYIDPTGKDNAFTLVKPKQPKNTNCYEKDKKIKTLSNKKNNDTPVDDPPNIFGVRKSSQQHLGL